MESGAMKLTSNDPRALHIVDAALSGGPWDQHDWAEHAERFGRALLETLRTSLPSLRVVTSVSAAYTAARGEVPMASAGYHETWAKVTLVWAARQVLAEAVSAMHRGDPVGAELGRIATDMLTA